MTGVEYVRQKCKEKGISIRKLEIDLGFSNGYLNLKRKKIPYDRAVMIAEYLNLDVNKILGLPEATHYQLNPKVVKIAEKISKNEYFKILFANAETFTEEDLRFVVELSERLKRERKD